jgi:hypothetical protein
MWSSSGAARALILPDPILGLPFGDLMLLVGASEFLVALLCFSRRVRQTLKIAFVAWMATGFLVYRLGLWCIGWDHPCGCMGSLAGSLHLSDTAADHIMKGVLAYLLVGSFACLIKSWRAKRLFSIPVADDVAHG